MIPVIDLDRAPTTDDLRAAYPAAGCFNVMGARLDQSHTRTLIGQMQSFFSLPDDHAIKQSVHNGRNDGANGWTPMLEEPAYEAGTVAWVESFDCVLRSASIADLPASYRHSIRPSIWPAIPGFRESVRTQWDDLTSVAKQLYPLVSGLLEQAPGFLGEYASSQALNTMRLLNYPPRPEGAEDITRGIAAHTDFECITLIYQTAPGLEVQTPAGNWIQVPVEANQWTVLLGDMVERWSNGRFRATPHRVPVTPWPRQSIVMFMAADWGREIRPLDAFVSETRRPAYTPITQEALISRAMARAESNRKEMLAEAQRLREKISPG